MVDDGRCRAEPKEDTMSRIITDSTDLHSPRWEMGTVVQEIHTGECCDEPHCDFYQPLWEMGFQSRLVPGREEVRS